MKSETGVFLPRYYNEIDSALPLPREGGNLYVISIVECIALFV